MENSEIKILLSGIYSEIMTNRAHLKAIESELANLKAHILEPSDKPQFLKDEQERIQNYVNDEDKKLQESLKKIISSI